MQKAANTTQFFYQNGKLITLITGEESHTIFRSSDVPLAEQQSNGSRTSKLLAIDFANTVTLVQEQDES